MKFQAQTQNKQPSRNLLCLSWLEG